MEHSKKDITVLLEHAWKVRSNASVLGTTKVGCALLSNTGNIYTGCNVEQQFRNHDVHAEVNAITNMIANGENGFSLIVIVAERDQFTPCGSCVDWIFQFGGKASLVVTQRVQGSDSYKIYNAEELMPHYPF